MVTRKVERKIEDLIMTPIPYADREIIEVAEGVIGVDLPGLPHIDLSEMSTGHKILLGVFTVTPYLSVEYLDLVGLDPFRADEADYQKDDEDLDSRVQEVDKFNRNGNNNSGRDMNNRNQQNRGNQSNGAYNRRRNEASSRNAGEKWGDIQKPEDSGISLPGSFNIFSIVKLLGVLGVFVIGGFLVTSLLGAGSGYANILGTAFGSETSAARDAGGGLLSGILGTAGATAETGTCLADSGCFQEFLLNQSTIGAGGDTSSKNTGQTFDLRVENLKVEGRDNTIPLRIYNPGYEIPVSFTLENKKQGEYGIEASKIDYKVNIYDPGFEDEVVCSTDWLDLEKGGGQFEDEGDLLVPGESATPLSWQEEDRGSEINLRNCGLLQPQGFKDDRVIELATKYDYSTTSTLKARGMSRTYLNEESEIDNSEPAKSKAPDTPVRTYFILNREPLQYFNTSGEYNPIAETAFFGIQTKKDNIGYHIQDFTLIDSTKTELENIDQCEDLKEGEGDNNYKISDSKWSQIQNEQDKIWLNDETEAITQMRCKFQLKGLENFNPTGEELLFTVRSDYRVKSIGKQSSFSIQNKDCSTKNCQMVKPLTGDWEKTMAAENPGDEKYWDKRYAKCKDWDDDPGCAIRKNGFEDTETLEKTINEGEIAVKTSKLPGDMLSCKVEEPGEYAGIEENELIEALESSKVLSNDGGNWEAKSKEDIDCGGEGDERGGDESGDAGDEDVSCGELDYKPDQCANAENCEYRGTGLCKSK